VEYRNLGNSGLQVSVVGLGCNNFGMRLDPAATRSVVEKAIDMGITLFDTADVYGRGQSEEFMAPALKPHRRNLVIATKSVQPMGEGPYWSGASRRYLMDALDACLRRLDTDYIDLYQMHRWDAKTPVEETMRALDDMVRSGKVRYIGSSTYTSWQVVEAEWVSRSHNLERFIAAQNEYSMLERSIQKELIPACERNGIGLLPFFPLASGFLTGKYRPGQPGPEGARLSAGPMASRVLTDRNYATLVKLEEFCNKSGRTMLELAFGWLASQPIVASVIAGATKPEQVEQNVAAGATRLTADEMTELNSILD
jgi:aryl-alcohol dehydrogenase-like predicted oxidoreductase